jgi:UDP-glucose 4-epimerase
MRWLITGGTGFIGRNLVIQLLQHEQEVIVVDKNTSFGSAEDKIAEAASKVTLDMDDLGFKLANYDKYQLKIVKRDLRDQYERASLHKVLDGVDVIVHLAALSGIKDCESNPEEAFKVNVEAVFSLLEQASEAKVKRFLFASSGAVFSGRKLPKYLKHFEAEEYVRPQGMYASSKYFGENLCEFYSDKIETVVLRLANVYGPYSEHKTSAIHKFTQNIIKNQPLQISGTGEQKRDFIYVDDVVDAFMSAGYHERSDISGEIFHIGSGEMTPIFDTSKQGIVQILSEVSGTETLNIEFLKNADFGCKRTALWDPDTLEFLDWRPEVSLFNGIEATYHFYKKFYK